MANIPDSNVAAAISYLNQAKSDIDLGLAQLAPTGAFWDETGVANSPTFSNQQLTVAATGVHLIRANLLFPPSDRYGAIHVDVSGSPGYQGIGIIAASQSLANPPSSLAAVPSGLWCWRDDGYLVHNGMSTQNPTAPSYGTGDEVGLILRANGNIDGEKNGVSIGTLFTGVSGDPGGYTLALVFFGANGSPKATANFANPLNPPVGSLLYV